MSNPLKTRINNALKIFISFMPWVVSMYLLYWLEYGGVWTTDTAHRGKISVAILVAGMGLSFLVRSRLTRNGQK